MHYLFFYMQMAILQSESFGRAVRVKDLEYATGLSRSTVNRYLKVLIRTNFVHKPKRGKYYLTDCRGAQAVGFSVVSPLEMAEYSTRAKNSVKDVT
jgi:DNA-binding IclR family transcriptional regulator